MAKRTRFAEYKDRYPNYRFELERLLLIAPAITEAVALDAQGMVKAREARLRPVIPEGQKDFSATPAFEQARRGQPHFGPAHYVGNA